MNRAENEWFFFVPSSQFLHRGTTVLHYEPDAQQVTPVFLKLERCNGTVTWCRPPWGDPRRGGTGAGAILGAEDAGGGAAGLDAIEDAVGPGLRLKYAANRSGETSLTYADEGYIDLAHMKDLSLAEDDLSACPESVRLVIHRAAQGAYAPRTLRVVYGSSLAENRTAHFLCPPEVADAWFSVLPALSTAIKAEDPRMVWLKESYLSLYFQDDLCMGPLAADAIKVRIDSQVSPLRCLALYESWMPSSADENCKKPLPPFNKPLRSSVFWQMFRPAFTNA